MRRVIPITRSFRKPIQLPAQTKWKLDPEDVSIAGHVVCFIETKGFIFNSLSKVTTRYITVTKQGVMIIYMTTKEGHVLKLSSAKRIVTRNSKKDGKSVCEMEVVFDFGAVTFFFPADETAMKWREILWAFLERRLGPARRLAVSRPSTPVKVTDGGAEVSVSMSDYKPIEKSVSMTTLGPSPDRCLPDHSPINTTIEKAIEIEEPKAKIAFPGPRNVIVEVLLSKPEKPKSPPAAQLTSVRKGEHGVSSIRKMLERNINKTKTSKSCFPMRKKKLEPMIEKSVVDEKKPSSARPSVSLRSISAPHIELELPMMPLKTSFKPSIILPTNRKIDANEEYDGCFHSVRA